MTTDTAEPDRERLVVAKSALFQDLRLVSFNKREELGEVHSAVVVVGVATDIAGNGVRATGAFGQHN